MKHQIKDKVGRLFNLFPDVYDILEELDQKWYKIGGLSADSDIRRIEETTDLFDIDKFFNGFEAKPGNKTEQMLRYVTILETFLSTHLLEVTRLQMNHIA